MTPLPSLARRIRIGALVSIFHARSGHPGGALSCADLLARLFAGEVGCEEKAGRNRFVLSKGHACPALYAALAERGCIARRELCSLRKLESRLQGHPHVGALPWVEASTGSLGQGFSVALGMALGLRHRGEAGRVYVMLGDGELQEGQVWEAALSAAHHRLANLVAIVDYNKMQSDDLNQNILALEPLADKWRAFGWQVIELDGHDFGAMDAAFARAGEEGKPTVLIAHTLKGRGVSYMEGHPAWHGSVCLSEAQYRAALADFGVTEEELADYV